MREKWAASDLSKRKRWGEHCVFSPYDFNHAVLGV